MKLSYSFSCIGLLSVLCLGMVEWFQMVGYRTSTNAYKTTGPVVIAHL